MDRNYSLYSGIKYFKTGITALALSAFLGASTTGCMTQQSGMPTVYRIQKSDITEEQYLGLSGAHRRQLDERGFTYLSENYVKQNVKPKVLEDKVNEAPAPQKVETEGSWFDRNKGWVIPVAIVGAAAVGYGISKAVDKKQSKKDSHKHSPKKGGSNPNVGPDQGDGSDGDKDNGSSDSGSGSDSNKDNNNF